MQFPDIVCYAGIGVMVAQRIVVPLMRVRFSHSCLFGIQRIPKLTGQHLMITHLSKSDLKLYSLKVFACRAHGYNEHSVPDN